MQKEWRMCRKKFLLSTMPDQDKGTVFEKNQMGDPGLRCTNYRYYFFIIINLKSALCVYGEYARQPNKPYPKIFVILVLHPR